MRAAEVGQVANLPEVGHAANLSEVGQVTNLPEVGLVANLPEVGLVANLSGDLAPLRPPLLFPPRTSATPRPA